MRADAARPVRSVAAASTPPAGHQPRPCGTFPADFRPLPQGLGGDPGAPRRKLGHLLAEPQGAGASMFVARARQQGSDFVAGLSTSCALPGLPFSSTFGLCPPTPWTTRGAQAGSRGTRASTRARGKAFHPAQFPSRIVGDLPQPPLPRQLGAQHPCPA